MVLKINFSIFVNLIINIIRATVFIVQDTCGQRSSFAVRFLLRTKRRTSFKIYVGKIDNSLPYLDTLIITLPLTFQFSVSQPSFANFRSAFIFQLNFRCLVKTNQVIKKLDQQIECVFFFLFPFLPQKRAI